LDGILTNVPNPDLLTTPLLTKEAVLSSRIEGTQATVRDVFEYEAGNTFDAIAAERSGVEEVVNYRQAMHHGLTLLRKTPVSENLIKSIHATLMRSGRGHHRMPGEFRRAEVYVGTPDAPELARYVPPLPTAIPELFKNLGDYMNQGPEKDGLIQIGVTHYQFEAIHPFMDGNGRIGRLLIPLMLYQQKRLSHPLIYISEFFEEHRTEYYDRLAAVSERGDWEGWLKFFLAGLTTQATKTQATALSILGLYDRLKGDVASINSRYSIGLLDIIFAHPIVSASSVTDKLGARASETSYSLIRKFVAKGILKDASEQKRNRSYVFKALIDLLH
jgi:Fic family protein